MNFALKKLKSIISFNLVTWPPSSSIKIGYLLSENIFRMFFVSLDDKLMEYFMTAEKFVRKSLKPLIKRLFKLKQSNDHWKRYRKSKIAKK